MEHPVTLLPIRPATPKWEVVVDRDLELRGQCFVDERKIVLRTFDEEVLLHEVLHALLHEGGLTSIPGYGDDRSSRVNAPEEDVVSHLSHGLFQAGFRWVEYEQMDATETWVTCPVCKGQPGDFDDERFGCEHCHGGGTVTAERAVKATS